MILPHVKLLLNDVSKKNLKDFVLLLLQVTFYIAINLKLSTDEDNISKSFLETVIRRTFL